MTRSRLDVRAIVTDAVDLADDAGFDAVTFSAVARRLGVRPPSLYSHVRDIAALHDAISEAAFHELCERVAIATSGRSGSAALGGLAEAHRGLAQERPGLWASLQRRIGPSVADSSGARTLVLLISAVLDGYALPAEEHVHATRLFGSTVNGFLALEAVGAFDHRSPEATVSWGRALTALDTVFRGWAADSRKSTHV